LHDFGTPCLQWQRAISLWLHLTATNMADQTDSCCFGWYEALNAEPALVGQILLAYYLLSGTFRASQVTCGCRWSPADGLTQGVGMALSLLSSRSDFLVPRDVEK
jgi:hypothetical protein